jgi:hypothetical protein
MLGRAMQIRKVATAATGHQDFFADSVGALENRDTSAARTRGDRAHKARSTAAEYYDVTGIHRWRPGAVKLTTDLIVVARLATSDSLWPPLQ